MRDTNAALELALHIILRKEKTWGPAHITPLPTLSSHTRTTPQGDGVPATSNAPIEAGRARAGWMRLLFNEDINFLLTNRVPRKMLTHAAGWFARIENRTLARLSIATWSRFAGDLHLEEAETQEFTSLHACFTRRLRDGVRPVDARRDTVTSPCDAIVGAFGRVDASTLVQAKGLTYRLQELLHDDDLAARYDGGLFVTLRLKASMYHRFHAPLDARLRSVRYIAGDTWNVNPVSVKRIERLFCRNERVVMQFETGNAHRAITLVPVAAILVASIRVHGIEFPFDLSYRGTPVVRCDKLVQKGEELGYFENGSTIIALATKGFETANGIRDGVGIRMGEPLFRQLG